jgi:hypothetical protein
MIKNPFEESPLNILERLAREGFLQNNRKLDVGFNFSCSSRFVELICWMKKLETLRLLDQELTLEDLAHVFQSCSKLIEVDIATPKYKTLKMNKHLKNQLRPGFQKLRRLKLECSINNYSWPVILEMLT